MSIQCKLISVASELLDFVKREKLDVYIMESNLDVLVNDEMYFLMQKMIDQNTNIHVENKKASNEQIFTATMLNFKKTLMSKINDCSPK